MRLAFEDAGWEDYLYWQQNDQAILRKINELIRDCLRHPRTGLGKPEALKGNYRGAWSRRITSEHRLVYRVEGEVLVIAQSRFHYDD